jgi:hypothetical protein
MRRTPRNKRPSVYYDYDPQEHAEVDNMKAPAGILVLEQEHNSVLYIGADRVMSGRKKGGRSPGEFKTIIPSLGEKYRYVLVINCKNTTIIVDQKLLTLNLVDCENCTLKMKSGMIGSLDLCRFNHGHVYIQTTSCIPILNMNICCETLVHTMPYVIGCYVVKSCMDCSYKSRQFHGDFGNIFTNGNILLLELTDKGMYTY